MGIEVFQRNRRAVLSVLVGVLLLAAAALPFVPQDTTITRMLPGENRIHQMLAFLHRARFASRVAVSFERSREVDDLAFVHAVEEVAARLKGPDVEEVLYRIDLQDAGRDLHFFQQQYPAVDGPPVVQELFSPAAVTSVVRSIFRDLMMPGGSAAFQMKRRDPFGLQENYLKRLQAISVSTGFHIDLRDGMLFSRDGNHILAVLKTSVAVTDIEGSKRLLAFVENALQTLPSGVRAELVCGHLHSVSNEAVLKRDVKRAVVAGAIGFFFLFGVCFRDMRAQFIFFIPLAASLIAVYVTWLFTGALSLFVIGFGVVVVGISVDYGIHIYVALRSDAPVAEGWRRIVRPVTLGSVTTLGVFAAFFTADIPGYRQLAVFSMTSITLSLLGALYVLPLLLNPSGRPSHLMRGRPIAGIRKFGAVLWLALFISLWVPFPSVTIKTDLRKLDGVSDAVLNAESNFRRIWGDGIQKMAMAVVRADRYEDALQKNEQLYRRVQETGRADEFSSFSSVWKSKQARKKNVQEWDDFWSPERLAGLQDAFVRAGGSVGFKPDAFSPFFEWVQAVPEIEEEPRGNHMFASIKERFVQQLDGVWHLINYFPDTVEWRDAVQSLNTDSDLMIISRAEIERSLAEDTLRIVKRVSLAAIVLVVLILACLVRNIRDILPALLPSVIGIFTIIQMLSVYEMDITIPSILAGIVVIGLTIDYGVFVVYGVRQNMMQEINTAVTLSTLTSLMGAGVLLMTRHPALFSIGVVLVSGITAGYVTALCVLPFCCRKKER